MSLTKKPRRIEETRWANHAVFKKRCRRRFFVLLFPLAALALWGLGAAYLYPILFNETSGELLKRVDKPISQEAPEIVEEATVEEEAVEEDAPPPPNGPPHLLTVSKLGLYGHAVSNDTSEAMLDLGAISSYRGGRAVELK